MGYVLPSARRTGKPLEDFDCSALMCMLPVYWGSNMQRISSLQFVETPIERVLSLTTLWYVTRERCKG